MNRKFTPVILWAAAIALFVVFSFPNPCHAEKIIVNAVIDGDTLMIDIDGKQSYVALYGIDAPELGQPFADESKNYVENVINTTKYKVTMTKSNEDTYKSCDINYIDSNGSNKNLACMVAISGLAFFDKRLDTKRGDVEKFISSEKMAKDRKVGIWSQSQISYPWDFRKQNKIFDHEVVENQEINNQIFSKVRGSEPGDSSIVGQGSGAAIDIKLVNLEKERLLRLKAKMRECDTSRFKSSEVNGIKYHKKYCEDQINVIDKRLAELDHNSELYFYEKADRERNRPVIAIPLK